MDVYIGSYAAADTEGIHHFEFDSNAGVLTRRGAFSGVKDPSFLALHPDGRSLLTVSEGAQGLVEIARDPAGGALGAIRAQAPTLGDWPCHVSITPDGGTALVSNYGTGNVLAYPLPLKAHKAHLQHRGSGPNTGRQAGPHAHSAVIAPDGRHAMVCDLGCDRVFVYAIGADSDLSVIQAAPTAPGAGPRHSAFHPAGRHLYVINELDSTLVSFAWDGARLRALATVPALPDDFKGESYCAEVAVHPGGRHVYACNRGHNSIAIFQVQADGVAQPLAHESVRGDWPRHFAISPDGRWLLVANQRSGDVQVFGVSPDGLLHYTGQQTRVPGASCICFVR